MDRWGTFHRRGEALLDGFSGDIGFPWTLARALDNADPFLSHFVFSHNPPASLESLASGDERVARETRERLGILGRGSASSSTSSAMQGECPDGHLPMGVSILTKALDDITSREAIE